MEVKSLEEWYQVLIDHNPSICKRGTTTPYITVACSCGGKFIMIPTCCGRYENGVCCGHPDPEPEFECCDGIKEEFPIDQLEQYLIDLWK